VLRFDGADVGIHLSGHDQGFALVQLGPQGQFIPEVDLPDDGWTADDVNEMGGYQFMLVIENSLWYITQGRRKEIVIKPPTMSSDTSWIGPRYKGASD
jgi:hypothetical protein